MVETGYVPTLSDVDDALRKLTEATERYREMDRRQKAILSTLVAELRGYGVTWQEIADAAGMSVQAAHKRWRLAPFEVPPPEHQDLEGDDDVFGEWEA